MNQLNVTTNKSLSLLRANLNVQGCNGKGTGGGGGAQNGLQGGGGGGADQGIFSSIYLRYSFTLFKFMYNNLTHSVIKHHTET